MFKKTVPAVITAALIATATFASDSTLSEDSKASITAALTEQGYTVGKIEAEDDGFEVEAMKGGKTYEIYLDAAYKVVRTEEDDD